MVLTKKHLYVLTAFKLMAIVSTLNIIALISIFLSGIFTLCQSYWSWTFNIIITAFGLPCYPCYCVTNAILSFHCLILFSRPKINAWLFSDKNFKKWLIPIVFVYIFYAANFAATGVFFNPEIWYWDYDDSEDNFYANFVPRIQECTEDSMLTLSAIIYVLFIISLVKMRDKTIKQSQSYIREIRVFIQTLAITFYSIIFNILWYHTDLFFDLNPIVLGSVNFLWLINHTIDPIVYFIVNRAINFKIKTNDTSNNRRVFGVSFVKQSSIVIPRSEAMLKPNTVMRITTTTNI